MSLGQNRLRPTLILRPFAHPNQQRLPVLSRSVFHLESR